MKPLIKWSGGKTKEIKEFSRFFPSSFSLYIEPFVGGGAVFFELSFNNNVINDIHTDLMNFYRQIKLGKAKDIYKLMKKYPNDEETYYFIRDEFEASNDLEKAFKFYYLRKTCYRGMLRYNKEGKFNIPFGRYKKINYEDILKKEYEELLKNTIIENTSFERIFEKYNNSDNFVFLDPPYDSVFKNYGFGNFDRNKHLELFDYFTKTKNKCLLVIGFSDFIYDLYKDFVVYRYKKKYAFRLREGRIDDKIDNTHLIITNYDIREKIYFFFRDT